MIVFDFVFDSFIHIVKPHLTVVIDTYIAVIELNSLLVVFIRKLCSQIIWKMFPVPLLVLTINK